MKSAGARICFCKLYILFLFLLCPPVFSAESPGAALPVWRKALGGAVTGAPSVQAGSVVVALDGGNIKAFTLDGKDLWEYHALGKIAPFVSRSREGTSYIYRLDGTLIALNRAGRELWKLKLATLNRNAQGVKAETLSAPVISGWDGRIFVPLGQKLFCYTASGFRLWSVDLESMPVLGPYLSKSGGLVMVLENRELLEVSHAGDLGRRALEEIPSALVPSEGGTLLLYKNGLSRLYASGASGRMAQLPAVEGIPVGGVARGNRAALLLSNGRLVLRSLDDGKQDWTAESHLRNGEFASGDALSMSYGERGIYVFTPKGASGFTLDGRRLWMMRLEGAASVPALSDEGVLYSGGSDWILYAYRLEDRPPEKRSLYGPLPEGSYGLGNPPPSPWAALYRYQEQALTEQLDEIARRIYGGAVGAAEEAYTSCLMEAAGSAMRPKTSAARPPVHVQQRAEAARLLGYIGSRETIAFLVELFAKDPDPVVKAAAAAAIGCIGADPEGAALNAFTGAALSSNKDEQVLIAAAAAAGSLCRFSGPPLSDSGIKLLNLLGSGLMPPKTRIRAMRELEGLR